VVAKEFVPAAGDLVWIDFTPQSGHEQAGRRPALVLSPRAYNIKTGLAVMCPVTNQQKGYGFEVLLPVAGRVRGVILADHLKNLDWRTRRAEYAGKVTPAVLRQVLDRISVLLQMQ
jgi:mRNA interferase MazF